MQQQYEIDQKWQPKKHLLQTKELLCKQSQKELDVARQIILQEKIPHKPLEEAVQYFMASWEDVLHPALFSLCCEAVKGNPDATTNVGCCLSTSCKRQLVANSIGLC